MKSVIYETKGRAREFNELAANLFTGCGHQCIYCYGANITHQTKEDFESKPRIRITAQDILQSAKVWKAKGETRRVLLCFVTDPYQPIEQETQLTRKCIMALHEVGLNVHILTKAGYKSTRDFDLLTKDDAYATTLTCLNDKDSIKWEPHASLPQERLYALKLAHQNNIETWVSFEPVIYPQDTFNLLDLTADVVGHYKVGTMNYHEHGKSINWGQYGWEMKHKMDRMGVDYYFKKDLLRAMGIPFNNFQQKWICR